MKFRMKHLFIGLLVAIPVVCLSLYIKHKVLLARQAATPPHLLITVKAIEPDFRLNSNTIYVDVEIKIFNIDSWQYYRVREDGNPTETINWQTHLHPHGYGETIHQKLRIHINGPALEDFTTTQVYYGFYRLPDQPARDWRNPTTLLEVGKTYKVTPEKPLLIARSIENNGSLHYSWLEVFDSTSPHTQPIYYLDEQAKLGYATAVEPKPRYWLTHMAYDEEPNRVRTRFAWIGPKPDLNDVSARLDPQYCWIEDSEIVSESIQVETSGAFSNGTQTADMTILLPEIPANSPEDVWLKMNFSQGSDDHRPVEIPVRRRTFYGDNEYPLGTRVVWRRNQPYADPVNDITLPNMNNYLPTPQIGGLLIYGTSIYKLDVETGASTELWTAPSKEPSETCSTCNVSPDGKYLAFVFADKLQTMALSTREMIETTPINEQQDTTEMDSSDACIYKVIYNSRKQSITFRLPQEENLANQLSAIQHFHDSSTYPSAIQSQTVSPDQKTLVSLYDCGHMIAYDINTGNELWQTTREHPDELRIEFSSDGGKIWIQNRWSAWGQLSVKTGEPPLTETSLNIPYINKLTRTYPNRVYPYSWTWSGEKNLFAASIFSSDIAFPGGSSICIFDTQNKDLFNAKQFVLRYLPDPIWSYRHSSMMEPLCFIGDNLLLVKCKRTLLNEDWEGLTELLCIDLREVPEI